MTYNAKQGLLAVVDKKRRKLRNDVIFRKKKVLIKEEGSMIVYGKSRRNRVHFKCFTL